jgi:hypothetical protein
MALFMALAALAGCVAPPTGYQPVDGRGYGFSSMPGNGVGSADYFVEFVGTVQTQDKQLSDFALLRASEIAIAHQFSYFIVLPDSPGAGIRTRDFPFIMTGLGHGPDSGASESPGTEISAKTLIIDVHGYANLPSAISPRAKVYNARQVSTELREKYGLSQPLAFNF